MNQLSRRQFMKKATILGAGITGFPTVLIRKSHGAPAGPIVVHPNIDNLRVVGVTDPEMTRGPEPRAGWKRQNELVNTTVVWENMDRLACALSKTRSPDDAWRTIFVKPPRKSWPDAVVAIKTNNISRQHTRSAVMAKICHTLADGFGVKPSNIHIYDACHGGNIRKKSPFTGLPAGVRIEDQWGGSITPTAVPTPWNGNSQCVRHLVDGTVDILINIAMCKGHSSRFGGFTMTMKNHFGTFSPGHGHARSGLEYLIAINKTSEILGPVDKRTGEVLFPRQQLCLVDALWASKGGPGGNPTHQPNFMAMGVLSPVVDYQVAIKFRAKTMDWRPNMQATRRMLSEFGYSEGDLPMGGKIFVI
jgi:hypothetical protein